MERDLYLACDSIQGIDTLSRIAESYIGKVAREQIHAIMQGFVDKKLMITEDNTYLSLAVCLQETARRTIRYQAAFSALEELGEVPNYYRITIPATSFL